MAAIAFDTLQFARRLKEVGVPEEQAEMQAQLMGEAFGFYVNDLVTRDYLDARFAEQEARIDTRFAEQDARIESRFSELETRIEARFSQQDDRFARIESRIMLVIWMLGLATVAVVVPALSALLQGVFAS